MRKETIISIASFWILPLITFAAGINDPCDVVNIVSSFARVFAYIVFVIAIAAVLYAGLLFIISGGSEQKVTTARNTLIWALIGIAVALFSNYVIEFVQSVVGGNASGSC